jgi:hypothetical protein
VSASRSSTRPVAAMACATFAIMSILMS